MCPSASAVRADVWRDPDIFDLKRSIGAPPEKAFKSDPFTAKWGQNWGFLYNWERMAQDNFLPGGEGASSSS